MEKEAVDKMQQLVKEERAGAGQPLIESIAGSIYVKGDLLGVVFYDPHQKVWRYQVATFEELAPALARGHGRNREALDAQCKASMRFLLTSPRQ